MSTGTAIKHNPYLIEKIQPQGGITFADTKYISSGGGYEACIHIYKYPHDVEDFWLSKICNIPNTVATIDISTENIIEAKKSINRSMKEQDYRYQDAKDFSEKYDAQKRYEEMQRMFNDISSMGEVVKLIRIRIFVADRSWTMLEKKIKDIMAELESEEFMPTIFLNETKSEWRSMYQKFSTQQAQMFTTYGQPLTSNTIAAGNPFHFSSLEDETGTFLGKTPCGGNVLFNLFTKTDTRKHYNFLAVGTMGAGKSTLLKKEFEDNAIKGNYVRAFDISGEFTMLNNKYGGKIIKADGSEGMLNPLEILRSGDNEEFNFTKQISKVSTIYKFWVQGDTNIEEITEFEELLRGLYQKWGFQGKNGIISGQVTGLPPTSYPIFSDLLEYIDEKMNELYNQEYGDIEKEVVKKNILIYNKIKKIITNIVNTYGKLFNGYTTIENIMDEQIITFDISKLKELKDEVFDAAIFNLVSLCWDNCVTNGKLMYNMLQKGEISLWDVIYSLVIIDESHRWINAKKLHALELITTYMREARKYFCGLGLASQSIRDYAPEGSGVAELEKLKTVFEFTQYKFIFNQESNVTHMINNIFDGVLTKSQINRIPKLRTGETILCISSDKNIEFKIYLTKEEEALYQGGI